MSVNTTCFCPYPLEVVCHFKLVLLAGNIGLHLRVGVVDDGQEHVDQHKEDEEHVEDEVEGANHTVSILQLVEVEVSQHNTEQGEAGERQHISNIYL